MEQAGRIVSSNNELDLIRSLQQCRQFSTLRQLDHYIRNEFRRLVPHIMALRGVVDIKRAKFVQLSNIDFPIEHANDQQMSSHGQRLLDCLAFDQWKDNFEAVAVQYVSSVFPDRPGEHVAFESIWADGKIGTIIISGLPDLEMGRATLFCFACANDDSLPNIRNLIDLATPYFHQHIVKQNALTTKNSKNGGSGILTKREKEMLELIYEGFEYQDIADKVGISVNTVRSHIQNIFLKFQVTNRTQALIKAIHLGVLNVQ